MIRRPPISTLFPYTPLSRSLSGGPLRNRDRTFRALLLPPRLPPGTSATGIARGEAQRRGGRRSQKRSEEHTSELQSQSNLVCRLLLEKKKTPEPSADSDSCL